MASVFTGTVAHSASSAAQVIALSDLTAMLGCSVLSNYAATAATTGVKIYTQYSIDGGQTYSDLTATTVVTAPTPSSLTAKSSQTFFTLDVRGATNVAIVVKNLDATNDATVALGCIPVFAHE